MRTPPNAITGLSVGRFAALQPSRVPVRTRSIEQLDAGSMPCPPRTAPGTQNGAVSAARPTSDNDNPRSAPGTRNGAGFPFGHSCPGT